MVQLFGSIITNDARCTREINSRIIVAETAFYKNKTPFQQQFGLKLKKESSKVATFVAQLCLVLKLGHCGKQIRNTWKVLKCGAGEGWRSVGPIV